MAGGGLWVPEGDPPPLTGPIYNVYAKRSELSPNSEHVREKYWRLLQEVPLVTALETFAHINNILAISAQDSAAHKALHEQFLEFDFAEQLAQRAPGRRAVSVIFHRLSNLTVIRNLVLYGANASSTANTSMTFIGELALCTNDFVQPDPLFTDTPTNLQLAAQFTGTWDLYNARDPACALPRMHTILTELLPSGDPIVTKLRTALGMDKLTIDTLTLREFLAIVFGLFAYGNKVVEEGMRRVVFDPSAFLREFPYAQQLLNIFLDGRALDINQLADKLRGDAPRTQVQFVDDLSDRNVLITSLRVFRQQPLLRLDDGQIVILDLQAVTDLLTSGVYWLLYDGLPRQRRETFRELWGRVFELYVTNLLRIFYPAGAQILTTDVNYTGGQIDALLDFGSDMFVLEIKSSLLTELAKRAGDPAVLAQDVDLKFIRNEKGHPKAVVQLSRAAQAISKRIVRTAIAPRRIYPVLITDEPACECFAFNAYLNEHFERELGGLRGVRPLTVMSVDECEELLPYVAQNAFSWGELCEARFEREEVRAWSVHQAIYDLRHSRGISVQHNEHLVERFDAIFQDILRTYRRT